MQLASLFDNLSDYIAAIVGLGTAACALVDSSKAFFGGISNCGFGHIKRVVKKLLPESAYIKKLDTPFNITQILSTLRANWLNGMPLAEQKALAKTLLKLNLNRTNAPLLAKLTGVDEATLTVIADKNPSGIALTQVESSVLERLDLMLDILLDEGYQRADQSYRNSAKAWSSAIAVMLAVVGSWLATDGVFDNISLGGAIFAGLAATPVAPLTKDLTSALATFVKATPFIKH